MGKTLGKRMEERMIFRFRILYEYYLDYDSHQTSELESGIQNRIKNSVPENEIRIAKRWLIDHGLLDGKTVFHGKLQTPLVSGISTGGIDLVERIVMNMPHDLEHADHNSIEEIALCLAKLAEPGTELGLALAKKMLDILPPC